MALGGSFIVQYSLLIQGAKTISTFRWFKDILPALSKRFAALFECSKGRDPTWREGCSTCTNTKQSNIQTRTFGEGKSRRYAKDTQIRFKQGIECSWRSPKMLVLSNILLRMFHRAITAKRMWSAWFYHLAGRRKILVIFGGSRMSCENPAHQSLSVFSKKYKYT